MLIAIPSCCIVARVRWGEDDVLITISRHQTGLATRWRDVAAGPCVIANHLMRNIQLRNTADAQQKGCDPNALELVEKQNFNCSLSLLQRGHDTFLVCAALWMQAHVLVRQVPQIEEDGTAHTHTVPCSTTAIYAVHLCWNATASWTARAALNMTMLGIAIHTLFTTTK